MAERPRLTSVSAMTSVTALVTFDQPMANDAALQAPHSYRLTSGPDVLSIAREPTASPVWLILTFAQPLVPQQNYTLQVVGAVKNAAGQEIDPQHTQANFTGALSDAADILELAFSYPRIEDSILQTDEHVHTVYTYGFTFGRGQAEQSQELFFEENPHTRALLTDRMRFSNTFAMSAETRIYLNEFVGDLHEPRPDPIEWEFSGHSVAVASHRTRSSFEASNTGHTHAEVHSRVYDEHGVPVTGERFATFEEYPRSWIGSGTSHREQFTASHLVRTRTQVYHTIWGAEAPMVTLYDHVRSVAVITDWVDDYPEIQEVVKTEAFMYDSVQQVRDGTGGSGAGSGFNAGFN